MVDFRKEIKRKTFHTIGIIALVAATRFLHMYYGIETVKQALLGLLLIVLAGEIIVLDFKIPILAYKILERKKERKQMHGIVYVIIAGILCYVFFDPLIAMTSMLMLGICDSITALIGIKYGKHELVNGRSIEGFIAGLIANLLIAAWLIPGLHAIVGMSVAASVAEIVTERVDDNLVVPLAAGIIATLLI